MIHSHAITFPKIQKIRSFLNLSLVQFQTNTCFCFPEGKNGVQRESGRYETSSCRKQLRESRINHLLHLPVVNILYTMHLFGVETLKRVSYAVRCEVKPPNFTQL